MNEEKRLESTEREKKKLPIQKNAHNIDPPDVESNL